MLLVLCLLTWQWANAQATMACCTKPTEATAQFAMLASDAAFRGKHDNPLPFKLQNMTGKKVTFKTPDGKTGMAYEIKAARQTDNYLFVIHEWWGLNDYIKQEAERLGKDLGNVNILALDLYDGKIATTSQEAQKYVQTVTTERAQNIIKGAIAYAGKDADIATIGWCFGGSWALQAGLLAGDNAEAVVMYYGMPEDDVERLKKLDAPVLGIFASQDTHITPKIVQQFEQNMKKAGKNLTVKMYDADHAFANPSNPKHNKAFTAEAYKLSVDFLKKHFD